MKMLLSGKVISASDACPQGVAISLAASEDAIDGLNLTIDDKLLGGFFHSEWLATFRPGRETTFNVANDGAVIGFQVGRSEEHTSELQSLMRISYAVFCLQKKSNTTTNITTERTDKNI